MNTEFSQTFQKNMDEVFDVGLDMDPTIAVNYNIQRHALNMAEKLMADANLAGIPSFMGGSQALGYARTGSDADVFLCADETYKNRLFLRQQNCVRFKTEHEYPGIRYIKYGSNFFMGVISPMRFVDVILLNPDAWNKLRVEHEMIATFLDQHNHLREFIKLIANSGSEIYRILRDLARNEAEHAPKL